MMKTLVFSKGEEYYYVKELVCPRCNWISTKKLDEQPPAPFISHSYQYDGEYFREAKPFTFWKIKSGRTETVEDDHELVRDYMTCGHDKPKEASR